MENRFWYAIQKPNLVAGTTTRHGGYSTGEYQSLNLAFHTGDDEKKVEMNRDAFSKIVNIPRSQMVLTYQSHSTVLKRVDKKDAGKGNHVFNDGIVADALYTTEKKLMLGIFHADCVPVFITHKTKDLIAIIHAGTPGSLEGISKIAIDQLKQEMKINPLDLIAYLGPSLDFAHHPISQNRTHELLQKNSKFKEIIKKIGNQYFLDIPLLNYLQLVDAGLSPRSIHVSNLDTYSNPKDYFSYERNQKTGRHISFIALR
ncbi:MAG: laccase domain-containing protein [Firmicutes bacterium]|nr:laccase domain-containing protein [Bacillota bacterium]